MSEIPLKGALGSQSPSDGHSEQESQRHSKFDMTGWRAAFGSSLLPLRSPALICSTLAQGAFCYHHTERPARGAAAGGSPRDTLGLGTQGPRGGQRLLRLEGVFDGAKARLDSRSFRVFRSAILVVCPAQRVRIEVGVIYRQPAQYPFLRGGRGPRAVSLRGFT